MIVVDRGRVRSRTWPASMASSKATVQASRPSKTFKAAPRAVGVKEGKTLTRLAPIATGSLLETASMRPAASVGGVRGVIKASKPSAVAEVGAAEFDELARRRAERFRFGCRRGRFSKGIRR